MDKKLLKIESRIKEIKRELALLGEMRPGSMTRQRRARGGQYLHLTYVYKGKGRTEYVLDKHEECVTVQLAAYKRFKALTTEWVGLAIEQARLRLAEK